ncbi:MAG: hypothetical protein HOV80_19215 [Polyangiaceae bacterium]|nr:hypothetical protein [Polyangiaceae bacterium]
MKEQSPSDPLDDPAIAALVDGAVARYEGTLSPAEIDALRSILAIQLASHPVLARLMARVVPRAAPLVSTEMAAEVADPPLLSVAEGAVPLRKRPGKKAQGG